MNMNCENCKTTEVKYKEWSPDGFTNYYCSKKCYNIYLQKMSDRGLVWRSMGPKKITKAEVDWQDRLSR